MTCAVSDQICAARGTTPTFMARVEAANEDYDEVPITQDDVATIRYAVFDKTEGGTETVGGALDKADVIFDTLQTGTIWTDNVDSEGFNFLHELPTEAIADDDHEYLAEYVITLVSGTVLPPLHFPILGQKLWMTVPSS